MRDAGRDTEVHPRPPSGKCRSGQPGTFPQVILTPTPTFHGLAINAVTNESAKTPPSGRGAKVLQPQYSCRARAGEFGKRRHTRIARIRKNAGWDASAEASGVRLHKRKLLDTRGRRA